MRTCHVLVHSRRRRNEVELPEGRSELTALDTPRLVLVVLLEDLLVVRHRPSGSTPSVGS